MIQDSAGRAAPLLQALADELEANGALRSERWRAAVLATPRHIFLPRFFHHVPGTDKPSETTSQDPLWLETIYTDQPLATQFNGEPGHTSGIPTSSSTAPGLMLAMLELLDLQEGHTVLEIGTGTGYNAALLSTYAGARNVTTIDVDESLTRPARVRLAELGLYPTVVTGDGAAGHVGEAPYDRIIATCAVRRIPTAWLEQTRPGGRILATVDTGLHGYGLALLTVDERHRGIGRFLSQEASFMPMRSDADPLFAYLKASAARAPTRTAATTLRPQDLESNDARFALGLALPAVAAFGIHTDAGMGLFLAHHTDNSWAELHPDQTVTAGGPTDLWEGLEIAYRAWADSGRPAPSYFELSVDEQEQQIRVAGPPSHGLPT